MIVSIGLISYGLAAAGFLLLTLLFRSVLVPLVAIPVSLIGALFLMQIFGFTLNLLTLLAIVLSVGLVVGGSIVIPHLRRAVDFLDKLEQGQAAARACGLMLLAQLKAAGFNVILTRTTDTFVDLDARPDIANRRGADLFVSLHYNATVSSKATVNGIETYCITPVGASSSNAGGRGASYGSTPANRVENQSLQLAYQVQRALTRGLGAPDRGVRRARFAVLRDAQMPAILVEAGYMTHPTEGKKIFDAAYRKQTAAAIVRGIVNYQKLTAPATATATNKASKTVKKP